MCKIKCTTCKDVYDGYDGNFYNLTSSKTGYQSTCVVCLKDTREGNTHLILSRLEKNIKAQNKRIGKVKRIHQKTADKILIGINSLSRDNYFSQEVVGWMDSKERTYLEIIRKTKSNENTKNYSTIKAN